jgi:hypothetical protein
MKRTMPCDVKLIEGSINGKSTKVVRKAPTVGSGLS